MDASETFTHTTIDEIKRDISEKTGIPVALLEGSTTEEIINRSRSILEVRKNSEIARKRSTTELFSGWFNEVTGQEEQSETEKALEAVGQIAEAVGMSQGNYPVIRDGGSLNPARLPDGRSAQEQFGDWLNESLQWDPFIDPEGWKRLI